MMASLGEKDDGQSRMGKAVFPITRQQNSIEHTVPQSEGVLGVPDGPPVSDGPTSTEPRRAGLPVLLEAGDCYERLARK